MLFTCFSDIRDRLIPAPEREAIAQAMQAIDGFYDACREEAAELVDALLDDLLDNLDTRLEEVQAESQDDGEHVMGIEDFEGVPFEIWEPHMCVAAGDATLDAAQE